MPLDARPSASSTLRERILLAAFGSALSLTLGCGGGGGATPPPANEPRATPEPFATELAASDGVTQKSRQCFSRASIDATGNAQPGVCPNQHDIVAIGLITLPKPPPPPQVAMTGTNLVDGPAEWKDQCCYLLQYWKTGRPLSVEGGLRMAGAAPRDDWSEPKRRS